MLGEGYRSLQRLVLASRYWSWLLYFCRGLLPLSYSALHAQRLRAAARSSFISPLS
jgi:hypothetical protein